MSSSVAASQGTKRAAPTPDWSIEFPNANDLKAIIDAVTAVMQRVPIKVVRHAETGGFVIMVDGADIGMTCCVSARLHIEAERVTLDPGEREFTFCVDCKHVQTALDSTSCAHGTLVLSGHGDRVHVCVRNPDAPSQDETSELKTFVDSERTTEIRPLEFATRLDVDVVALKEVIKKARKWHAEMMKIRISLRQQGARHLSMVAISISGDADHEQRFYHETTRDDDGSLVVRAASDGGDARAGCGDDLEPHFEGTFLVDRIDSFVRIVPQRMVSCNVMRGMPLMLTYPIGGDEGASHIRYLVAPVNDEE